MVFDEALRPESRFATKRSTPAEPDPTTSRPGPDLPDPTYAQEARGKHKGFEYALTPNVTRPREHNSRRSRVGARFCFASGLAATTP